MEEKISSATGYVDCTPTAQEAASKEVFTLLKKNFYWPERIREMSSVDETIATAADKPCTTMVPRHGMGSNQRFTSKTLCDPGFHVRQEREGFRVISMRNDSSALLSKIMVGDLIVRVNNVPMNNNNLTALTTLSFKETMTGDKGSTILVSIKKNGKERNAMATRTSLRHYAEFLKTHRDDVCAIRIERFTSKTYNDICNALRLQSPQGIRGVILDLRGNSGGTVESAVDIASLFIGNDKNVMNEMQRKGHTPHTTQKAAVFNNVNIGMLVDRQSASASEILVGTLQHHTNGLLLGHRTFGKGSIQHEFDVTSIPSQRLKMTISQWMTPAGQCIHGEGFKPDVYVDDVRLSPTKKIDSALEIAVEIVANELPKRNVHKKHHRRMQH